MDVEGLAEVVKVASVVARLISFFFPAFPLPAPPPKATLVGDGDDAFPPPRPRFMLIAFRLSARGKEGRRKVRRDDGALPFPLPEGEASPGVLGTVVPIVETEKRERRRGERGGEQSLMSYPSSPPLRPPSYLSP